MTDSAADAAPGGPRRSTPPGAPPGRPEAAADPGLFGPDSVTWQLHADPVMWIAGVRALYLQALHPLAVRAVLRWSGFREDPIGRLLRTARFVAATTYGTGEQAEAAASRVRTVHHRLAQQDPELPVDRPDLLLWVHCAEVSSYLALARRAGFPLTDAQADTYLDEQRTAARLVGLDPADVPGDRAAMRAYFAHARPALHPTPESAEVLDFLLAPPVPARLRPVRDLLWRPVSQLAYSALPPFAHACYRRRPLTGAATTAGLHALRRGLRTVPDTARWQLPPRHILTAVERLGPGTRPSPRRLTAGTRRRARRAILDPGGTGGASSAGAPS